MLIKTENSKAIMDFLNTDPLINLNIIGVIENLPQVEIYVDDPSRPTGVYVKKDYFSYIYSKSEVFINEATDTFIKEGFFGFSGTDLYAADIIKKKYQITWQNECTVYYLPKENLNLDLIKNEVRSIALEDAETVNELYQYSYSESLEVIKRDITQRPSSAVYVDGEIVCWVLIHDDNSMGIMYTKEAHRRKGYAIDVTVDLADKIIKNGKIPYIQIVKGNNMSPGLALKCGFVECGKASWFGIAAGTPKQILDAYDSCSTKLEEILGELSALFLKTESKSDVGFRFIYNCTIPICSTEDFKVSQVEDEASLNAWAEILCKNMGIEDGAAAKALGEKVSKAGEIIPLLGTIKDKAVSACMLLKQSAEDYGLYLLSVVPEYKETRIALETCAKAMEQAKDSKCELLMTQASTELAPILEELGWSIKKNN